MEARELRIGNLVKIKGSKGTYTTVTESTFDCNVSKYYGAVRINENWLLKLGFEKGEVTYYKNDIGICDYHNDNNWLCSEYSAEDGLYLYIGKPIKYVHQLQNLYYALTGEELTLINQ